MIFELGICYHQGGEGAAGAAHDDAHRIEKLIRYDGHKDDVEYFPAICNIIYTDRQLKQRGHTEMDGVYSDKLIEQLAEWITDRFHSNP